MPSGGWEVSTWLSNIRSEKVAISQGVLRVVIRPILQEGDLSAPVNSEPSPAGESIYP
jgi:hypothetical protein